MFKEKQKVETLIFRKDSRERILWKDIKHINFQDNDVIDIEYVDPICTTDHECDGYFCVEIIRLVEETDEEYNLRMDIMCSRLENSKKVRYAQYLKLKEEFER